MAWGSGGFKSCDSLLSRIENNDPNLVELVILPMKTFGSNEVDRLASILKSGKNTNLKSISASGKSVSSSSLAKLGSAIATQGLDGIRHIAIGDDSTGDEGVVAFCSALEDANGGPLEEIDFAFKNLTKDSASALGRTFGGSENIKKIHLYRNSGMRCEGVIALCMAAKESAEKLNSTPFPSLEYLDLSNCEIDGEGVKALSQLLLSGSNGHNNGDQRKITLDLNSNPIGSDACQSLSSLCSPRLDKDSIIKSLSLKKCSIGDDGFQVFAKGLLGKSCGGLCKLDLTGNGFGPKGLIDFADAMKTGLRDLRDLCLADNSVKEEGVIALSSALRDNNLNLSVVDLSNTHCGSLGAKSILQCNTLSSIRLFNNNLGCAGFEVIGSLLEEGNSSVSHLDIGGNRAKNGAVAALLRVILQIGDTGLSNLHTLELGGNEIGEEVESVLKDLQEKRPGLDIPRDRPNVEQPANMQP